MIVLLREELGLNQKDFADYVGCSESTLQAVERGPKRLKLSEALAELISLKTGVSPDWLLANDFKKPMLSWAGLPYNKEFFIQSQDEAGEPFDAAGRAYSRESLSVQIAELFSAYVSAENEGKQTAWLFRNRFARMTKSFANDFGLDSETMLDDDRLRQFVEATKEKGNTTPPAITPQNKPRRQRKANGGA